MNKSRLILLMLAPVALTAALAAQRGGGTRLAPGQECPPGTTEVRPGSCLAPADTDPAARNLAQVRGGCEPQSRARSFERKQKARTTKYRSNHPCR